MPEVTQLVLSVDSRQVKTATGDLGKLASAGKSAEKEAGALARAYQSVGRVFGAVAASVVAREVIQAADAYKNMNARLQLVSKSASEFATAQEAIFNISQRTRSGLVETSDLYASLSRSTQALGVSQDELLKVTESINQAMVISGTSAADAQGALVQLGQAFASGTLRGDELNSILERTPRLSQAIANGLGVPEAKLRELGASGQLTAEKLFRALQKSAKSLQEEFEKMPTLVEQSINSIGRSISRLIGMVDKATGATSKLADVLTLISKAIDGIGNLPKLANLAGLSRDMLEAKQLLDRLKEAKNSPWAPLAPNLDAQIAEAERKFSEARRRFKIADGRMGAPGADDQSTAEARRLGLTGKASTAGFIDTKTIAGLQAQIKALKDLRDNAKVGSADFKRYSSELKTYEDQLKRLLPSGKEKKDDTKEVFTDYREQIAQRVGGLLEGSDVTQAQIYADTLKQLDALFFAGALSAEQYDSAVKKLSGSTSSASDNTSDFLKNQERLKALLTDMDLESQRSDMELLTNALTKGAISADQYLEAVSRRLGLVAEKTKETKSLAEDLGLSFSSAFEDAAVGGKKASDVIKGLIQDVTRLFIRKQATEPFANAVGKVDWGSLISGIFGGASANALGGVYNSPGLSAYSGSIVNTPTLFPFARGAGLMGEAGPEAILPLERGRDGKLGVVGGAGGNVVVNVNNQGGALQVTGQRSSMGADGTLTIDVMVEAIESRMADKVAYGSGPMPHAMESRYGLRPAIG